MFLCTMLYRNSAMYVQTFKKLILLFLLMQVIKLSFPTFEAQFTLQNGLQKPNKKPLVIKTKQKIRNFAYSKVFQFLIKKEILVTEIVPLCSCLLKRLPVFSDCSKIASAQLTLLCSLAFYIDQHLFYRRFSTLPLKL